MHGSVPLVRPSALGSAWLAGGAAIGAAAGIVVGGPIVGIGLAALTGIVSASAP
jgi:hypothetical protein